MKLYKLIYSTGDRIRIDEDDYAKFGQHCASGNFILLKQGLVNPSYVVGIMPIGSEAPRKVIRDGFVDEKRGVFIPTKVDENAPALDDAFSKGNAIVRK